MKPTIGIIGGSGLYSMPGFEAHEERKIDTPWGAPSDAGWHWRRVELSELVEMSRRNKALKAAAP